MAENGLTNGHVNGDVNRPIRIGGASGGVFDRFRAISDFAKDPSIDVIFGDWMSEISMTFRGSQKIDHKLASTGAEGEAFESSFLAMLKPAISDVAKNKQKVIANAGGYDVDVLARRVQDMCKEAGTDLTVSWITGDEVTDQVNDLIRKGEKFSSLPSNTDIDQWGVEPVCAQCYLGGVGIAEALRHGADIVVCGRVADASPVVGAAMWWHNWGREDFTQLAHALIAGHLIECSSYVTGGYFTGFKKFLKAKKFTNLGFPIAEIAVDGEFVVTKEKDTDGEISIPTITGQLVYEIQGPLYYNSDVTANLEQIKLVEVGPDRVRVTGVVGSPPPPTTKVGITAKGGWQAECHFFLTGLDIKEKAEMIEKQTIASMGEYRKEFHKLEFTTTGSVPCNPRNQDEATVDFRIFAQTRNPDVVSAGKVKSVAPDTPTFAKWVIENCLQGYPGGTPAMDMRQGVGKPYFEYWVSLISQDVVNHELHTHDGKTISIPPPTHTKTYLRQQSSYETSSPLPVDTWGPTTEAPMGYIVHGRSGDKSSDCNVGFFVRHDDEWDWLRSTLSIAKIRELLEEEDKGGKIDRFEIPNCKAVHFLLRDHLDRGANSSSSYDILGKNVCEYLRAKLVDMPRRFLERGRI